MTPEEVKLYGEPLFERKSCVITSTHQKCSNCLMWLKRGNFSKNKAHLQGVGNICKRCDNARHKSTYQRTRRAKYATLEKLYGPILPRSCGKLTATHKHCCKCGKWLEHKHFSLNRANLLGLGTQCKACSFDTMLKRKYDISALEYFQILKTQNNKCAICKCAPVKYYRGDRLHVDHDHTTGVVRGLLCANCNVMLGNALDSPTILRQGAQYLEGFAK